MRIDPDWQKATEDFAFLIATEQLDRVEQDLNAHPDKHPNYHRAVTILHEMRSRLAPITDLRINDLSQAWRSYADALAVEMYLYGVRDGGRIYHAFVTNELPKKEDMNHVQSD